MKTKTLLLSFVSLLFIAPAINAQTIKANAELRTRSEFRQGFRTPLEEDEHAALVSNLRTKLNLSYAQENLKVKLSLLDTRTYGETAPAKTGEKTGILEAWGEYAIVPQFSFVLGRQALEYDDKRLFSANNWSNTPGAHDLLLLKYNVPGFTVHGGAAWNNAGDVWHESLYTISYKSLFYVWLSKPMGKLSLTGLWVNDSFQQTEFSEDYTDRSYRNTIGTNFGLKDKDIPFSFYATAYYQFGHDKEDRSLRAWLLALKLQQKFSPVFSIYGGGDLFSGTEYENAAGKNRTFNKLYGTNHAFNGSIEYWATLPKQGLLDLFIGTNASFSSKFGLDLVYHYFSTQREIDDSGTYGIGSEMDITANYHVSRQFTLQGGWSTYFTNRGTDLLKNQVGVETKFPQWAYIQVTFKPTFL